MRALTYVEADVPAFDFDRVAALLHFEGVDAATIFTDETGRTWTAAGNAQLDTAQFKFGSASGLFDGTGDYISTPDSTDFTLGSGDWTVDAWFNCNGATATSGNVCGQGDAGVTASLTSFFLGRQATDEMVLRVSNGTVLGTLAGTTKFTNALNTGWHHVAAVRTGDVLKLFVDGVQEGGDAAFTGLVQDSAEPFTIGARSAGGGSMWNGWLDEVRVTVGLARWTANFTPPTAPAEIEETFRFTYDCDYAPADIEAIPSLTGVQYSPSTISLGKDIGTRAQLSLTFSDHRHIFLTEPFTQGTFWGKWRARYGQKLNGRPLRWIQGLEGQTLAEMETRHFVIESNNGPSAQGGQYAIIAQDILKFADGDRAQAPLPSNGFMVGSIDNDDLVFTLSPTGIGNNDYPRSGYVALGGKEIVSFTRDGGNDSFTKVLLHLDGADNSTTITDSNAGGSAHTWTAAGNAQIDNAQSKFGGTSLELDGTGDWVSTPDHADFALGSGDFTFDCWFRCNKAGASDADIGGQTGGAPADTSFFIDRSSANVMRFFVSNGSAFSAISGTTQFTNALNTGWHHLAAVRSGNTLRLFIDGVQEASTTFSASIPNVAGALTFGRRGDVTNAPWVGWLDEIRLSVGVARWTANFTPPVRAHQSDDIINIAARAQLGTDAASHDAGSRVQLVLRYVGMDPADIIYDLLVNYAGIPASYIPLSSWQNETQTYLQQNYSANIAEPTDVSKLVSEIIEQAALAIWWEPLTQLIRLQVLRGIPTTAAIYDEGNTLEGTLSITDQPATRISQVLTYFGQRDPLAPIDEERNFRSAVLTIDGDAEIDYGTSMIKKIFSRWIPFGARTVAVRLNDLILGRFRDPPRRFTFNLFRYGGDVAPELGGGYRLKSWAIQDETGAATDAPIQITRHNPLSDRFEIQAEEMLFENLDPADLVNRAIIIDSTINNVNLREIHDTIYPEPTGFESPAVTLTATIEANVIVGSNSAGTPAFDIGSWPVGITINLIVLGDIRGAGGLGGLGGNSNGTNSPADTGGHIGGTALYTRYAINLTDEDGRVFGGGGGGGGGARRGGGGGGGAGVVPGEGGGVTTSTESPTAGTTGTQDAGGAGGDGGGSLDLDGGTGGAPGLVGDGGQQIVSSGLFGGAGGPPGYAVDGISFVTQVGPVGDRRGTEGN